MRTLRAMLRRFVATVGLDRGNDIAAELEAHLLAHIEDNIRAGLTPEDARHHALLSLGGLGQTAEAYHDRRHLAFLEKTMLDLRYALRMLAKTPGFAAAAILTLALGIGANTAIFSVLNAVILKPLEYQQPERLMKIASQFPNYDEFWISLPEYLEFRKWTRAFSSVGAYQTGQANLSANDRPQRVRMMQASEDLFTTLRVGPLLGRTFEAADVRPGTGRIAILSEDVWRTSFSANPNIIGQTAEIDGVQRTIVGVM